jgi:16S rRNA (uracil1498-N3)-methyltransferase
MIRFFVAPSDMSGGIIRLSAEDTRHINSLRMRPGELFIACDGEGTDYICRLGEHSVANHKSQVTKRKPKLEYEGSVAEIVGIHPFSGEPTVACNVFIAFAKGERLDYAVQKSVELGALNIVIFPSERCVSSPGDISKKTARLQRIALETAKQCGRSRIPAVSAVGSFGAAVRQAAPGVGRYTTCNSQSVLNEQPADDRRVGRASGLSLFFYEQEEQLHLKQALEQRGIFDAVSIVTGPEGGFEPHEAELARSSGLITVSLGPRILRCETAPVAALAAIMFYTGNL